MRILNLLRMTGTLSQLRGCSIILHLGKRMIFSRLRYFSVSGIVRISGIFYFENEDQLIEIIRDAAPKDEDDDTVLADDSNDE